MCVHINFKPMHSAGPFGYMRLPLSMFPHHIIQQYDLRKEAKNIYIYVEIRRPPTSGNTEKKALKKISHHMDTLK